MIAMSNIRIEQENHRRMERIKAMLLLDEDRLELTYNDIVGVLLDSVGESVLLALLREKYKKDATEE